VARDTSYRADGVYGGIVDLQGAGGAPAALQNAFAVDPFVPNVVYLNDGIGVLSATSSTYTVDSRYLPSAFDPAFVEIVDRTGSPVPEVPPFSYDPSQPVTPVTNFSRKWAYFANRSGGFAIDPNHIHLIAAADSQDVQNTALCTNDVRLGETANVAKMSYSYIFAGRMERLATQSVLLACGPQKVANPYRTFDKLKMNGEVVVHELAHQWHVNEGTSKQPNNNETTGHDPNSMWNNSGLWCTMDSRQNAAQMNDDLVGFHWLTINNVVYSEYLTIRRRPDPNY
jgi:hypothetical protein